MDRKRLFHENILNLLGQINLSLDSGSDLTTACRIAGVSAATYYAWRKKYGGMDKDNSSVLILYGV